MDMVRFYWQYVKPYWFRFITAMFIAIPLGLMDGLIPWTIKPYFDALTKGKAGLIPIEVIPFLIILFSTLQGILGYFSRYLEGWVGQRLVNTIRIEAFNKMLSTKLQIVQKRDSGYVLVRIFNDPIRIQGFLLVSLRSLLSRSASIISIAAVLFMLNWKLALIAISALGAIAFPMMEMRKKIFSHSSEEKRGNQYIMTMLTATVAGLKVILSFNLQKYLSKRFKRQHDLLFSRMMTIQKAQAIIAPVISIVTGAAIAVIMWYGCYLIVRGEMTAGGLIAFITSLLMLYRPMRAFGDTVVAAQRQFIALERFMKMMTSKEQEVADTSHLNMMAPLQDKIEVQTVYFKYRNREDYALNGVSLTIPRGQMVALVGRSGSGKTTLAEIIMGLYALKRIYSTILFDGISIHDLNMQSVRNNISYVSQETFLFDGTLRENILLGRLDATEADILKVLEQAHLADFVASLPEGLDTPVGEQGVMLSGGQRQRLAIARAFLKNAPILILDEATSSLDNESEAAIQAALEDLMVDRTTLVIAHRLSTIQKADKIVVLDAGQVVEEGTHAELLEKAGMYYHLFHAQRLTPPTVEVVHAESDADQALVAGSVR